MSRPNLFFLIWFPLMLSFYRTAEVQANEIKDLIQQSASFGPRGTYAVNMLIEKKEEFLGPLIATLNNKSPQLRKGAIYTLGKLGDKRAVMPFIEALKEEVPNNYRVRAIMIEALDNIGDSRALKPLIEILKNMGKHRSNIMPPSGLDSGKITSAVVKAADESWNQYLITVLKSNDPNKDYEREAAAQVLGIIGDANAVEPLIAFLKSETILGPMYAAEALGKIKDKRAVGPLVDILNKGNIWSRIEAAKALGEIGDTNAVDPLIVLMTDKNSKIRENSAEALGKLGDKRATEALIGILKNDPEKSVRIEAAKALGKIADKSATEALIGILTSDPEREVRIEAVRSLGKLRDSRAVEPLITALADDHGRMAGFETVSENALKSLVLIGSPAVEPLIATLNKKDLDVKALSVIALGKIKDKRAIEPLSQFLLRDDFGYNCIRDKAAEALANIGDTCIIEQLIVALKYETSQNEVSKALGKLGDEHTIESLHLELASNSNNDIFRVGALRALVWLGDTNAVENLKAELTNWETGRGAAETLTDYGWKPESVEDTVHYYVAQRNEMALRRMWNKSKKTLLNDIESCPGTTRKNALCALIGIGDSNLLKDLINILNRTGDKSIAEEYLNCGNKDLRDAAEKWAKARGYSIGPGSGSHHVNWGSFR